MIYLGQYDSETIVILVPYGPRMTKSTLNHIQKWAQLERPALMAEAARRGWGFDMAADMWFHAGRSFLTDDLCIHLTADDASRPYVKLVGGGGE